MLADGPPELPSGDCVRQTRIERPLRNPNRKSRNPDTSPVEHSQGLPEPVSRAADEIPCRNCDGIEHESCRVAASHPQLVFLLPHAQTLHPFFKDKRCNPPFPRRRVRCCHDNVRRCHRSLRDEALAAIENPVAPLADCRGDHRAGIASGGGLRQRPCTQCPPGGKFGDVRVPLLFIPIKHDMGAAKAVVRSDSQCNGRVDPCKLLDHHDGLEVAQPGSFQVLGPCHSHEPEGSQLADDGMGELL